ncbi:MAG TPA: hypothetical protein EYH31_13940 [Anaerolineae bacterium]|nr:hypothetical protein [Anaerolineae bacterium]
MIGSSCPRFGRRHRARKFISLLTALGAGGLIVFLFLNQAAVSLALFNLTGEEAALPQVKGLMDLTADMLRPHVRTDDFVPVAYADVNPFGINTFLQHEVEPAKREQQVRMIAEAGFHWLRQEFPWEDIEIHGKGDFMDRRHSLPRPAWEKYDQIVDLAEKYGLELIVRLSNPPGWTRALTDTVGTYAPPDDYNDFGDFVYAVVSRYRGRIRYYQLWNEPNIYPEWGSYPISPEDYTRLLRTGYTRAKEADPNVVIISGALAATSSLSPDAPPPYNALNDFLFLQRMYDAGAAPYFDILAMQGYGLWSGPTDQRMQPRVTNFSRPRFVRDIMVRNGDSHKPIWISEMNWNAAPLEVEARYGRVTLSQQARYVQLAYQRIQEEWPWVGVVNFWYFKRATDEWERNKQPEAYFRMVTPDFQPLPVYWAMKDYTARLPVMYRGFHQEDHWAIRWQGDWKMVTDQRAVFGEYRRGAAPTAALSFRFHGRELVLVVPVSQAVPTVLIQLDDQEARLVHAVPRSGEYGQYLILVSGLKMEDHQITISSDGEVPLAVDGFIVS